MYREKAILYSLFLRPYSSIRKEVNKFLPWTIDIQSSYLIWDFYRIYKLLQGFIIQSTPLRFYIKVFIHRYYLSFENFKTMEFVLFDICKFKFWLFSSILCREIEDQTRNNFTSFDEISFSEDCFLRLYSHSFFHLLSFLKASNSILFKYTKQTTDKSKFLFLKIGLAEFIRKIIDLWDFKFFIQDWIK